jgi:hypothetical protein
MQHVTIFLLVDLIQMENFILNLGVDAHGVGNVVRNFVLSIVTQKLVINFLQQKTFTMSAVKERRDLRKRIIAVEVIIAIVKSGGKASA